MKPKTKKILLIVTAIILFVLPVALWLFIPWYYEAIKSWYRLYDMLFCTSIMFCWSFSADILWSISKIDTRTPQQIRVDIEKRKLALLEELEAIEEEINVLEGKELWHEILKMR